MWYRNQKRKYNNTPQIYRGVTYQSTREATKAWELDALKKSGEIKKWTRQVNEELFGEHGTKICIYKVDFLIEHNNGTLEFIEIKSPITATDTWKLKWKLLLDKYKNNTRYKFTIEYQ